MTAKRRPSLADQADRIERARDAGRAQVEATKRAARGEAPEPKRRRVTLYLSGDLYEEARAAVLDLGAQGETPGSISTLLDAALRTELERLRAKHREGKPWPRHKGGLPGGRPRKEGGN